MNQRTLTLGALALIVIGAGAWMFFGTGGGGRQEVSEKAPVDVVLDFYDEWMRAAQSTSTDPYQLGLADNPFLSAELRARLADAEGQPESEPDPVLCVLTVPEQISARSIFQNEKEAQILVMSRATGATEQAVITLTQLRDGWYMSDITCSLGEFAPERGEFSFENEGFLLKSVVAPLDPEFWHLVFEQGGEQGHAAPLLFGAGSMCEARDGSTAVCAPDQFTETSKAFVQGEMTERGVDVKRLELR